MARRPAEGLAGPGSKAKTGGRSAKPRTRKTSGNSRIVNQELRMYRSSWKQELQLRVYGRLAAFAVGLLGWTLRFDVEGWEHVERLRQERRGAILSFWHNQILLGTIFWRDRDIMVMASPHFDGELTGRMIEHFGFQYCSGSSSRGAVRALLRMRQHLARGLEVAFTVDGPRGPVYKVQPGPLWLSRKSRCPIVCFHIQPRRYWTLKSWDGFRIPKPFTRCLVKIWAPLPIPSDEDKALDSYQREMDRLREYCEAWGRRRRR